MTTPYAMPSIGLKPIRGPNQKSQHQAEDQRADVEESGRQRRHAELIARVQHSHGLRRQRHQQQKGNMMRVSLTASSNLPGTAANPGASTTDQLRAENHAQHAQHAHHDR